MDHLTSKVILHKKMLKFFPWVDVINQEFTKSFPSVYETESLKFLNTKIQKELLNVSLRSNHKRTRYLFEVIGYFYNHFCWKIEWNKHCSHMKASCVQLLADFIKVTLMLSRGNVESLWFNRILAAIQMFPGSNDLLYDALLGVSSLKRKYQNAYGVILKHVLMGGHVDIQDPIEYLKVIFLFRRLKFLIKDPKQNADIAPTAAKFKPPSTLKSWLLAHNLETFWNVDIKTIGRKLMRKSLDKDILLKLREIIFSDMSLKNISFTPKIKKVARPNDTGLFVIDTNGQADARSEMVKSNYGDSLEAVPYSSQPSRKRKRNLKTVTQENIVTNFESEEFKPSVPVKKKKQKMKTVVVEDIQTKTKPILGDVIGQKTKVDDGAEIENQEPVPEGSPCIKVTSKKKKKRRARKTKNSIDVEESIKSLSSTPLLSSNSEDIECIAISSSSDLEDIPVIVAEVHSSELISNSNNVSMSEAFNSNTDESDTNSCEISSTTGVGERKMRVLPLLSNKAHLQREKLSEDSRLNSSDLCDKKMHNESIDISQPVEPDNQKSDLETEVGSLAEEGNLSLKKFSQSQMNDTKCDTAIENEINLEQEVKLSESSSKVNLSDLFVSPGKNSSADILKTVKNYSQNKKNSFEGSSSNAIDQVLSPEKVHESKARDTISTKFESSNLDTTGNDNRLLVEGENVSSPYLNQAEKDYLRCDSVEDCSEENSQTKTSNSLGHDCSNLIHSESELLNYSSNKGSDSGAESSLTNINKKTVQYSVSQQNLPAKSLDGNVLSHVTELQVTVSSHDLSCDSMYNKTNSEAICNPDSVDTCKVSNLESIHSSNNLMIVSSQDLNLVPQNNSKSLEHQTIRDFKSTEDKTEAVLQEQSCVQMQDCKAGPNLFLNPDTASMSHALQETSNCFSTADDSELEKSSAKISYKEPLSPNESIVCDVLSNEVQSHDASEIEVKKTENVDMGILESVGLRKKISVQVPVKIKSKAPEMIPSLINEPSEDGTNQQETNTSNVNCTVGKDTDSDLNEPSVVDSSHAASEEASKNETGILTEQEEKDTAKVKISTTFVNANELQDCTFGDDRTLESELKSEVGVASGDKVMEDSTKLPANSKNSKVENHPSTAVSYLMEKMLQRVEMADLVDKNSSFETLKHNVFKDDIKFTPDTQRSNRVTGCLSSSESTHKAGRRGEYLSFSDVSLRSDFDCGSKSLKESTGSSVFDFYRELFSDLDDNWSEAAMSGSKIDESECSDVDNCSDSDESETDLTTSRCHSPSMSSGHSDEIVSSKCNSETAVKTESSSESNPEGTEVYETNNIIDSQNLQISVSRTCNLSSAEFPSSFTGDSTLISEELALKEHLLPVVYLGKNCDSQNFPDEVLNASKDSEIDDPQASNSEHLDGKRKETSSNNEISSMTENSTPFLNNPTTAITESIIPSNSLVGDSDVQKGIVEDLQTNSLHVVLTDIFSEKVKLQQNIVKPIMPSPPTRRLLEASDSQEIELNDGIKMESVGPTSSSCDELNEDDKELPLGRKLRSQTVKTPTNEKSVADASYELNVKPSISTCRMSLRERNPSLSSHRAPRKSVQKTPTSITSSARRSSKRLKREVNLDLGLHFSELSLDSPNRQGRLRNPPSSKMPNDLENNESDVNTKKEKRMTTRASTVLKISASPTLDHQESDPEGYNLRSRRSVIMPGKLKF